MTMTPTQATTLASTSLLCPETLSKSRTRLINELVQGRDLTTKLHQILLDEPSGNNGSFSAHQIVGKILRSFTESISVLSCDDYNNNTESSVLCEESLRSSDEIGSENSIESKKRLGSSKIGRGCYKRRKSCLSWVTVGPTIDDGHAWRKYGQKDILNAAYPRCYFRCTHKFDQGCKAIKQVQKMEDNPQMYKTTYIGVHTCREIINSPQMIRDSESWEPYINNTCESKPKIFGNKQEVLDFTSSALKMDHNQVERKTSDNVMVKKEQKEEETSFGDKKGASNDEFDNHSIWRNDLSGFGSIGNFLNEDTGLTVNNNNDFYYYSCGVESSDGFDDLDLRFGGIGDGDFQFGECEFS